MSVLTVSSMIATVMIGIYLSRWVDQKIGAGIQARVGPNRAGYLGLLQPLVDLVRLFRKKSLASAEGRPMRLWWIQGLPLILMVVFTPFGSGRPMVSVALGAVVPVFLLLCFSWAGLLLAWQGEQIEGRFISIRQANLSVAVAIPVLITVALAGMAQGGIEWERLIDGQGFWPHQWLVFSNPAAFVAAVVFLVSGMVAFSVRPFATGGQQEIFLIMNRFGHMGLREIWIRLSRQIALLCWLVLLIQLFFGGAALPATLTEKTGGMGQAALGTSVLLSKLLFLEVLLTIVSKSLPEIRSDQSHSFVWKVLFPSALISLALSRVLDFLFYGVAS